MATSTLTYEFTLKHPKLAMISALLFRKIPSSWIVLTPVKGEKDGN